MKMNKNNFKIYIDQGIDQKQLKKMQKKYDFSVVQANNLEQDFKIATDIPKGFILDQSSLDGPDFLVDKNIYDGLINIFSRSTKQDIDDTAHIYSAYEKGCQYFLTNNPKSFINGDKRKRIERLLKIKIMTLDEFEAELKKIRELRLIDNEIK